MPDRNGTMNMLANPKLANALRALPDAVPQPDLWPDLVRSLARRRRRRVWRSVVPLALAAGLALAMLWPQATFRHPTSNPAHIPSPVATRPQVSAGASELAGLQQRSQNLERWVAAVAAHAPQDSRDLMAAVEVEDLIGLVDVQLGAVRTNSEALPLWRQRVALLEDLATIRGNAFAIAANDDGATQGTTLPVRLN